MMDNNTLPPAMRRQSDISYGQHDTIGMPWFEDGTIIIHAQSTRFKVYRGMLADKSAVFADMLSRPTPSSAETDDLFTECPIIRLSDSAEDWEHMLDAVFNRRYTFTADGTPLPCTIVCSLLRLAHKYQFAEILEEIMERLSHSFPSTLEDWDAADRTWLIATNPASRADECALLAIARDLGLHPILPALLYQCVATGDCPIEPLLQSERLGHANAHACILGYRRIVALQARTTLVWATNDAIYIGCSAWPSCFSARQKIPRPALCGGMPLVHLLETWNDQWAGDMCRACKEIAKVAHESGRREGWRQLPHLFGLPPWEELLVNGKYIRIHRLESRTDIIRTLQAVTHLLASALTYMPPTPSMDILSRLPLPGLTARSSNTDKANFAMACHEMSVSIYYLGQSRDALQMMQKAVKIRRELVASDPAVYSVALAQSLGNMSNYLSDLGRHEEARKVMQEADEVYDSRPSKP
ncbi:hypothetical protein HWV62_40858 [Athelia sp. TMB]|nr:hypothetical protein HWV62_40858 [Athelia sp. TMB]